MKRALTICFVLIALMIPIKVQAEEYPICEEIPLNEDWQIATQIMCEEYSFSYPLLLSICQHESSFRPDVVNSSGHVGLTQISPKWFKKVMAEVDVTEDMLTNAFANVEVCVHYLSGLFEQGKELEEVLMIFASGSYHGTTTSHVDAIIKDAETWDEIVYGEIENEATEKAFERTKRVFIQMGSDTYGMDVCRGNRVLLESY